MTRAPLTGVAEHVVIDASAMVDLLAGTELAGAVASRLNGAVWHAPAHFDAEVLSALGRLQRAGRLSERRVTDRVRRLRIAPVTRHALADLLAGAWSRRETVRLTDALYCELAAELSAPLVTTDLRLSRAFPGAEPIALPQG